MPKRNGGFYLNVAHTRIYEAHRNCYRQVDCKGGHQHTFEGND